MPILKREIKKDFTVVHNAFIRDENLGISARGLLLTMLSMADGWKFSTKLLVKILPDGEKRVSTALQSLEEHGYLRRRRLYDDNGRIKEWEYLFSDEPIFLDESFDNDDSSRGTNKKKTHKRGKKQQGIEKTGVSAETPVKKADKSGDLLQLQNVDVVKADVEKVDVENSSDYKILSNQISSNQILLNQSINQQPTMATSECQTETSQIDGLIDKKEHSFSEILGMLGINNTEYFCFMKTSEEDYNEYNEGDRYTETCQIPYSFSTDKKTMLEAVKYLFAYSYRVTEMDKTEIMFLDSVISVITELTTSETSRISNRMVKYHEVIDKTNAIIRSSSLYDWYIEFKEHWENILAEKAEKKERIKNLPVFLKSCIANHLLSYGVYSSADEMSANGFVRKQFNSYSSSSTKSKSPETLSECDSSSEYERLTNYFQSPNADTGCGSNVLATRDTVPQMQDNETVNEPATTTVGEETEEEKEKRKAEIELFIAKLRGETEEDKKRQEEEAKKKHEQQIESTISWAKMLLEDGRNFPKSLLSRMEELGIDSRTLTKIKT